jgi:hypothetical protein
VRCALALAGLLPLLAYAFGCDAVGGAVVDETLAGDEPIAIRCLEPPNCEEADAGPPIVPRPLLPVDLERCRQDRDLPCVPPVDAGAPDDTPHEVDASAEGLDAGTGVPCGPPPTEQCGLVVVESTGETPASTTLSGPVWSGVEVAARSEQPFEVVIENGWLFDVSITLHGPITLRIRTAEFVQNLRVLTAEDHAGEARLVIEDSVVAQISTGEPGRRFAGSIDVLHSELRDVQLVAGDLQLESGKVLGGLVAIDDLNGIDAELADLELSFGNALLAAFTMSRTAITRCGALTLIEGTAVDTQFVACEWRPARVYSTGIVRGAFDGSAEADRARFVRVVVGLQSPTEIVAFSSNLNGVALCEHMHTIMLGSVSSIRCSSCPDGSPDVPADAGPSDALRTSPVEPPDLAGHPPEHVCFVPSPSDDGMDSPTADNFCELPQPPPVCAEPHPVRRRPLPEPF